MKKTIDTLYQDRETLLGDFVFDRHVVEVFPDMIKRSVPGYSTIVHMIGQIAHRYAQPNSLCYDLGCSLGAATLSMQRNIQASNVGIVAIDNSPEMIEQAKTLLQHAKAQNQFGHVSDVAFELADITHGTIERASVVVLNFTLQFVPIEQREALLRKIYDAMLPGGVLVLSEKLKFDDEGHQALMTELHHDFKKTNGYSDMEIAKKRAAIENVLLPETLETHTNRLKEAGFCRADTWFQCFNFSSIVAFK